MADIVDVYTYKSYELIMNYSSSLDLEEGQCEELDIYITDTSRHLLTSEFRKRVNQAIGENQ